MDFDDGDCPIWRVFGYFFTKISGKCENVIGFTLGVGYLVKFQLLYSNAFHPIPDSRKVADKSAAQSGDGIKDVSSTVALNFRFVLDKIWTLVFEGKTGYDDYCTRIRDNIWRGVVGCHQLFLSQNWQKATRSLMMSPSVIIGIRDKVFYDNNDISTFSTFIIYFTSSRPQRPQRKLLLRAETCRKPLL